MITHTTASQLKAGDVTIDEQRCKGIDYAVRTVRTIKKINRHGLLIHIEWKDGSVSDCSSAMPFRVFTGDLRLLGILEAA